MPRPTEIVFVRGLIVNYQKTTPFDKSRRPVYTSKRKGLLP